MPEYRIFAIGPDGALRANQKSWIASTIKRRLQFIDGRDWKFGLLRPQARFRVADESGRDAPVIRPRGSPTEWGAKP